MSEQTNHLTNAVAKHGDRSGRLMHCQRAFGESRVITFAHRSSNHSTWDRKYHVVFTPKYRKKLLYGHLRGELREVLHRFSRQKACEIVEGHLMPGHVHMLLSVPPKHAVAHVIGFMKGKSSIWIAQNIKNRRRNFAGHKFCARGDFVSTTGADEQTVRRYICNQETQDRRLDDLFDR